MPTLPASASGLSSFSTYLTPWGGEEEARLWSV